MGQFDKFADTPDQIRKEGQEITLKVTRTGPTTARLSWNIPTCGNAYNGIVLTVASKPANYLSTSPKSGTFYNGDPTVDADLHSGDNIDGALVLAALYNDKTTTSIDVTDLADRGIYYFSAYAVDNVARYHREGVHGYALPSGTEVGETPDKAAKHDIGIDLIGGVVNSTPTGLVADTQYTLKLKLDNVLHSITIEGENAGFYGDLVAELNEALAKLGDVYTSPLSPHTDELYFDAANGKLFKWNGSMSVELPVLVHSHDPVDATIDALWLTPSTKVLRRFDGDAWSVINYIETPFNPASPGCEQSWFDGTNVWLYKTSHWEKLYTYIQTRNPLLAPLLSCDHYWFDKTESELNVWNIETKKWDGAVAIYYHTDPNALGVNDLWYDEKAAKFKKYLGEGAWVLATNVVYVDKFEDNIDEFDGALVFDKSTEILHSQDGPLEYLSFPVDPANRSLCKLWWDSNEGADILKVWDELASTWVEVTTFVDSAIDPSKPQPVVENSAWYNPDTKEVKLVFQKSCKTIFPIINPINPLNLAEGTVWHDTSIDEWFEFDGSMFNPVELMVLETNPYVPVSTIEYYWFDPDTNELKEWNTPWAVVEYVTTPVKIPVGKYWFDSTSDTLFVWDGRSWVVSLGVAAVELLPAIDPQGRSILSFFTREIGCAASIEIVDDAGLLLSFLTQGVVWYDPVGGLSGMGGGLPYQQIGVGTDGSPDERRALHNTIRNSLGAPSVQAELTKEQLDLCIDNALQELRKKSSYSYQRGFFFLDLKPNQQTYFLTNKCVGFNKIVGIHAIHRVRGAMLKTAVFSNDVFGQAALQQLYTNGTFDILTYHLVASYMEELETLFAGRIMYRWHENKRELSLHQGIGHKERVLLDAYIERTEQELLTDRQTTGWVRRWAVAEAKKILSQTRGKFQSLPGPNGTTSLNGEQLASQADAEMELLRNELEDMTMQDLVEFGARAHLFIG